MNYWIKYDLSLILNRLIVALMVVVALLPINSFAQKRKPAPKDTDNQAQTAKQQTQERQELTAAKDELADLMKRVPSEEFEILQALASIKNEMKLRELRWRVFERGPVVVDEPFVYYPIKIELLGTYERLTDMMLSFAASNYLVIIDNLKVERARQQAPLVSTETSFNILLYAVDNKVREQILNPTGTLTEQLEKTRQTLTLLSARFEERVACWTAMRALGRKFPRSLENLLTSISINNRDISLVGISRRANMASQWSLALQETLLFEDLQNEQQGPTFKLQAKLNAEKAYQQWLEGSDNTDLESLPRDPFTTIYSIEQLSQGSGANANYPPLEKRLEEYLQAINQTSTRRPDRTSPYLISELALAGLYYTNNSQGAIFKTPNQKELAVPVGVQCYNGRFSGVKQGQAIFEENLTDSAGKTQVNQISKPVESSQCFVVNLPIVKGKPSEVIDRLEMTARSKIANSVITLNVANVELHSLLALLYEVSGRKFEFVIDRSVPHLCISINKERIPLGDMILTIVRSANLSILYENGIFRIISREQAVSLDAPVVAYVNDIAVPKGSLTAADFKTEPITLSLTDAELSELLKFITAKYKIEFTIPENLSKSRFSAYLTEKNLLTGLIAILRAAHLGLVIEGERSFIVSRDELLRLQIAGKVKFEP